MDNRFSNRWNDFNGFIRRCGTGRIWYSIGNVSHDKSNYKSLPGLQE